MNTHFKSLAKPAAAAALLTAMLALSGCVADDITTGSLDQAPGTHGSDRYPIKVAKGPQTIEIDAHKGYLTNDQANAVRVFVHQAQVAGATPLIVSHPAAKSGPAFEVTGQVAEIMEEQGIPHGRIHVDTYPGNADEPVRISFISTFASTKPCGNWEQDLTTTDSNESYPNLGCAVQSNIAAELAYPQNQAVPATSVPREGYAPAYAAHRAETYVNSVTLPSNYDYAP